MLIINLLNTIDCLGNLNNNLAEKVVITLIPIVASAEHNIVGELKLITKSLKSLTILVNKGSEVLVLVPSDANYYYLVLFNDKIYKNEEYESFFDPNSIISNKVFEDTTIKCIAVPVNCKDIRMFWDFRKKNNALADRDIIKSTVVLAENGTLYNFLFTKESGYKRNYIEDWNFSLWKVDTSHIPLISYDIDASTDYKVVITGTILSPTLTETMILRNPFSTPKRVLLDVWVKVKIESVDGISSLDGFTVDLVNYNNNLKLRTTPKEHNNEEIYLHIVDSYIGGYAIRFTATEITNPVDYRVTIETFDYPSNELIFDGVDDKIVGYTNNHLSMYSKQDLFDFTMILKGRIMAGLYGLSNYLFMFTTENSSWASDSGHLVKLLGRKVVGPNGRHCIGAVFNGNTSCVVECSYAYGDIYVLRMLKEAGTYLTKINLWNVNTDQRSEVFVEGKEDLDCTEYGIGTLGNNKDVLGISCVTMYDRYLSDEEVMREIRKYNMDNQFI